MLFVLKVNLNHGMRYVRFEVSLNVHLFDQNPFFLAASRHDLSLQLVISLTNSRFSDLLCFHTINSIKE